jgi:preprotein translocase subunit YajC
MNNLLILLQAANEAVEQNPTFMQKYGSLFFIILLIVVFWLFFIRPQSKKAKEEQKYRESLQKGDKVVTIGGLHGKVVEVKETTVIISLSPNNEVEVEKSALVQSASRVGQA